MSKITFSSEDIDILNRNTNVLRVSEKSITYADEFKWHFIEEYLAGKLPRIIFEEAGFDLNMLGYRRAEQSACRWLRAYNQNGIIGLRDTRTENSGRPRIKELTQEEIIAKQEAKIKLLEGQVELLKKADKIERRLVNGVKNLNTSNIFN